MGSQIKVNFVIIFLFFPSLVLAYDNQTSTTVVPPSTSTSISTSISNPASSNKTISNYFNINGYIDGSYNNLNRNYFTSGSFDRVFDVVPNGFTLQQAAITLAYQPPEGYGVLINPIMGRDVNIFAPYGFQPVSEFDSQTFAVDVPQAYLDYNTGKFTISGGRFLELAGEETLAPIANSNFSRSILYGVAEPFTILGVRGTYVPNDKLTFIIGVNNGWDNIRDWSRDKTIELSVTYVGSTLFTFSATSYTGQERAAQDTDIGPEGWRTLIDLIATFNITSQLSVIANYDYGWQTVATLPNGTNNAAIWHGIATYLNYQFNDRWQTSLRGEFFNDENGYRTGVKQTWKEVTFTVGYSPIKNWEFRAEARHDFSNVNSFTTLNGSTASNNDQSYALESFYKFG